MLTFIKKRDKHNILWYNVHNNDYYVYLCAYIGKKYKERKGAYCD